MKRQININKLNKKKLLSVDEYVSAIANGDRVVLSKAITLVESNNKSHQVIAEQIIEKCLPLSGKSFRIGITGVPGVGKSTFIEALGMYLIQQQNKKVAVLAIDPSSSKSSGSILGDKTRMNELSAQENAFIRPSPSSGTLGGVARATRESIILCEAAGYGIILVETVGVGQSETEVKLMVDFFLLLMLAGAGDELQGIKRGIMEMADALVINKAEGDNIDKAKAAKRAYQNALHLFPPNKNAWIPKVETCSAIEQTNINEIWKIMEDFQHLLVSNGFFDMQRKEQIKHWLQSEINQALIAMFNDNTAIQDKLKILEKEVLNNTKSPFAAANELINKFKKSG